MATNEANVTDLTAVRAERDALAARLREMQQQFRDVTHKTTWVQVDVPELPFPLYMASVNVRESRRIFGEGYRQVQDFDPDTGVSEPRQEETDKLRPLILLYSAHVEIDGEKVPVVDRSLSEDEQYKLAADLAHGIKRHGQTIFNAFLEAIGMTPAQRDAEKNESSAARTSGTPAD